MQGSLVTQNRLRFDFNLHRGLKDEEVARVEELVNGWVAADTELVTKEMPLAEAKAAGERTLSLTCYVGAILEVLEGLLRLHNYRNGPPLLPVLRAHISPSPYRGSERCQV